jgi:hypothetical protein
MNTRGHEGLEWFRLPERNTLPPLCVCSSECEYERVSVCLRACPCNAMCLPFYSFKGGTYKDAEPRHAGPGA